jgi:hypothetical protein
MGRQILVEDQGGSSLWLLMSSVATRFGRETVRGLSGCKLGMQGADMTIEQFAAFQKAEVAKGAQVIKAGNIKLE